MSGQLDGTACWDRRRLMIALVAVIGAGVALVFGLLFAIYFAISTATPGGHASTGTRAAPAPGRAGGQVGGPAYRNAIAAAPMLKVEANAAAPGTPAASAAPTITIPNASTQGPAGVPSGFPRTPDGAIGQLAVIEQDVLQSMSIPATNSIHAAWALPGAPGIAGWPLTQSVQAFLGNAQMGNTLDPTSTVVVTPQAAQVKGTDGQGWVLACVLVTVHATITADARMGYGYCERMQWHAGRWMIAPGAPPASAPSTWPGTDLSNRAGWRTWAGTGGN